MYLETRLTSQINNFESHKFRAGAIWGLCSAPHEACKQGKVQNFPSFSSKICRIDFDFVSLCVFAGDVGLGGVAQAAFVV